MTTQERAKIIRELDKKYGAYCEKKVNEAWNGALEKAAKIAHRHAKEVNSLSKPEGLVNCATSEGYCIEQEIRALQYKL